MAKEEIQYNDSSTLMVVDSAIATFEGGAKHKTPVDKEKLDTATEKIALWGDMNDLPQQIITQLEKNQDLGSLLDLQARVLYGGGVDYELVDPETEQPLEKPKKAEITAFLRRNWAYPMQACIDFYRFFNVFPQFTLNKSREKIHYLIARPANFCRYALQNKQDGRIKHCYVNADWEYAKPEDLFTLRYPVLHPMYDRPDTVKPRRDGFDYIYGLSWPMGKTYYSIPNWWALKQSKWLELANKIPAFKLALMNNQITIKYHIQFPDTHWEFRFPNWNNLTPKQKAEAKEDEIKKITDYLKGEEKAGKSLVTGYHFDRHHGKEFPGIKIEAIDDKLKDGMYLEDSVEATIKIFTAIGLDPSILGIVPGKGGSNRSGSDKREAVNIYTSLITPHAHLLLRPYEFIADYNGWNTEKQLVKWRFKSMVLQTLDAVTPGRRETLPDEGEGGEE